MAETEKYAHVTYFFNGGVEAPQPSERRELAPSPRDVPTYDHAPEMSAAPGRRLFVRAWREDRDAADFGSAIINFANADMVGHTGVIAAAVRAVETVDRCLGEVVGGGARGRRRVRDHCRPRQRRPHARARRQPQHRALAQPRPADRVTRARGAALRGEGGILADVAPTVLELLGIDQPAAMTGRSLIETGIPAVGGCSRLRSSVSSHCPRS